MSWVPNFFLFFLFYFPFSIGFVSILSLSAGCLLVFVGWTPPRAPSARLWKVGSETDRGTTTLEMTAPWVW